MILHVSNDTISALYLSLVFKYGWVSRSILITLSNHLQHTMISVLLTDLLPRIEQRLQLPLVRPKLIIPQHGLHKLLPNTLKLIQTRFSTLLILRALKQQILHYPILIPHWSLMPTISPFHLITLNLEFSSLLSLSL